MSKSPAAIVWFRNDLRIDDNPLLSHAAQLVKDKKVSAVLPVYILDPFYFGTTKWGSPKTGQFRIKFLLECLEDLKQRLRTIGSDLHISIGPTDKRMADLAKKVGAKVVLSERQVTDEEFKIDRRVQDALRPLEAKLSEIWGNTLYHIDDVPFAEGMRNMPDTFTPFKEKCERQCKVRRPEAPPANGALPLPVEGVIDPQDMDFQPAWGDVPAEPPVEEPAPDDRSAFKFPGGETEALKRLKHYVWDTDAVATYFETRNGMLGLDYSTKLSAHLAYGCISARRIHHEIADYERKRTKNKSTYWVSFELTWRDFFRFFGIKHGNKLFKVGGTVGDTQQWSVNQEALQRWKDGTTGWPLVDANMRELKETGWMSNRGRQNVASYLILDLGIDWRLGADHFESLLLDYDVTSNWGNWVAAAGLTGGRVNKFNITKQSKDYDAKGDYVRAWIPELKGVTGPRVHEPWSMDPEQRRKLGAEDYPERLVGGGVGGPSRSGGKGGKGGGKSSDKGKGKGKRDHQAYNGQRTGAYDAGQGPKSRRWTRGNDDYSNDKLRGF